MSSAAVTPVPAAVVGPSEGTTPAVVMSSVGVGILGGLVNSGSVVKGCSSPLPPVARAAVAPVPAPMPAATTVRFSSFCGGYFCCSDNACNA